MDLHIIGPEPTDEERATVDGVLGAATSAWAGGERDLDGEGRIALLAGHEARSMRDRLLPALHAVQERFGWIPQGALTYICRRLTVPPAEAWGVATFYHMFSMAPRPAAVAHVCDDIGCRGKEVDALCRGLEAALGPAGHAAAGAAAGWQRSPCLGQCERGPAVLVTRAGPEPRTLGLARASTSSVLKALSPAPAPEEGFAALRGSVPQAGSPDLRLLGRVGRVDPGDLEAARRDGAWEGFRRAVALGPEGTIREVTASKLMGRGGAAFPTGRKWEAVAKEAARPHWLVCFSNSRRRPRGGRPGGALRPCRSVPR